MKLVLLTFALLLGVCGCAAKSSDVHIFAAASTQEALQQAARDYERQSGTRVLCSFAASSTLARQIEEGADADLFLSADERWADHLAALSLVAQRQDLLANRLVVVTRVEHPLKLQGLADLTGSDLKHLAVALEPVPAGSYAREALKKAGIWEQIKERVREAGDVRATLALVERDEAEAGLVYATDATVSTKVRVALEVPETLHTPIRYPLVLLRHGAERANARAFYDFLQSDKARAAFRKMGFQIQLTTDEHR
jgi:molybdate transport system substrate-binding protein